MTNKKQRLVKSHLGASKLSSHTSLDRQIITRVDSFQSAIQLPCNVFLLSVFDSPQMTYEALVEKIDNAPEDQLANRRDRFFGFLEAIMDDQKIFQLDNTYWKWRYVFKTKKSLRQKNMQSRRYLKRRIDLDLLCPRNLSLIRNVAVNLTERNEGRLLISKKNILLLGHDEHRCTVIADGLQNIDWLKSLAVRFELNLFEISNLAKS
jgi:hypothetical protein